jgi:8-oxo-dGTP pyrophosphatase MutT (NUDIX family)
VAVVPNFDPRLVPVIGIDRHLPPISSSLLEGRAIEKRFFDGHEWAPEFISEPRFVDRTPVAASVLIPIVEREKLMVLLTERTLNLSSHSGQISFPGGKADAKDRDPVDTALRETHEEIGVSADFFKVLGVLPTYTTGSGYIVSPVVALMAPEFKIESSAFEVAEVFEVPLHFLINPSNHRRHAIEWEGAVREWLSIPYQDGDRERFIWGATAAMLRNLYQFLRD